MPVSAGALTNADINFPFHFRTVLPFRRTMDYNVPQHSSPTPSQLSHALPFSDSAHSFPGTFPPITALPHLPFRATLLYSRGQAFGRAYGTGRSQTHSPRLQHAPKLVGGCAPKPLLLIISTVE